MHPHCCLPTTHQMQQGVPQRATQLWHKHNTHTPALEAVLLSIAPQLSASTCAQAQPHVGQILLELPNVRNLHHCMASAQVTSSASRQQHTHAPPQQTESGANNARTNLALHQPQVNIGDILSCAKQRSRAVCMGYLQAPSTWHGKLKKLLQPQQNHNHKRASACTSRTALHQLLHVCIQQRGTEPRVGRTRRPHHRAT